MSETGRIVVFLSIVLGIWAVMHVYVFWRVAGVPLVAAHVPRHILAIIAGVLWATYPLARLLDRRGLDALAYPLELLGAAWMGVLFLAIVFLLAADLVVRWFVTPTAAAEVRGLAVACAFLLGAVGFVQWLRPPAIAEYEVRLAGLPAERDGTVLVAVSDLHLGSMLGPRWFARRIKIVAALRPDVVAVVGDLIDGNAVRVERMLPTLKTLKAPLGVWAVTGNHEFYAGLDASLRVFAEAGYRTLRDTSVEVAPGLVLAGVDDLTARQQFNLDGNPIERALTGRPPGATILLSHTPWKTEEAARLGAQVVLSGHTHDGQIWPFRYLVQLRYPLMGGRYEVGGSSVIVCRGTGTWGPPIRLWRRSEIVKLTLRRA